MCEWGMISCYTYVYFGVAEGFVPSRILVCHTSREMGRALFKEWRQAAWVGTDPIVMGIQ